ncbi:MAG: acyl-CoA-binding protein [Desulfarculus sp.]|nr:acyl-CoA-binding protein [Desulfarculus sp.]
MSELEKTFTQAAVDVRTLPSKPDTMTLLKLYALYKQGSQGDISGQRPQGLDPVGNAKYDAWAELKGISGNTENETHCICE